MNSQITLGDRDFKYRVLENYESDGSGYTQRERNPDAYRQHRRHPWPMQ